MEIRYDVNSCKLVIEDYEKMNWKDGSEMLDDAVYEFGRGDVSEKLTHYDEHKLYELQRQFWSDMNIEELLGQLGGVCDNCYENQSKGEQMIKNAETLYELLQDYLRHILGEFIEDELSNLAKENK